MNKKKIIIKKFTTTSLAMELLNDNTDDTLKDLWAPLLKDNVL